MSKYRGPRFRVTRRLGELPAFTKKTSQQTGHPGQHGTSRRKPTQFAFRLTEKQKLRFYYGVSEKKLIRYVKAARTAKGSTGQLLLQALEIRLDNIIYRIGWRITLPEARQLVNHGHILVNQRPVTIPSYLCSPSQVIKLQRKNRNIHKLVINNLQRCTQSLPSHLSLNVESLRAIVNQQPDRQEIPLNLNELLVVEYYSNRLLLFHTYL